MKFQIEPATLDQAPAIAEALLQAFVSYKPLYTAQAFAVTTPDAETIRTRWHEGPVWVAWQDHAVRGTVAAVPKVNSIYIRSMAVIPAARGMGIGRALIQKIEEYAIDNGSGRLFLSTTPFLKSAIRLYEAVGFARIEEGPHDLHGTPLFTMEKLLV